MNNIISENMQQGRRRVFKSGPAEEAIECRIPLSLGGFWGPPPRIFLNS